MASAYGVRRSRVVTFPTTIFISLQDPAVFALVSIALGTLMGAALYKWLTETFGGWQLQIGRVGSYVRRRAKR
jgi:hypothetical protein